LRQTRTNLFRPAMLKAFWQYQGAKLELLTRSMEHAFFE